jgi:hypothetical protein
MDKIRVGEIFSDTRTNDLSQEFIQSAFDLIEETKTYDRRFTRSKIVTSCVASFLSIEAYINRIFFDCYSASSKTKLIILPSISEAIKMHIKASWSKLSIKDKCIIVIPLVSKKELKINDKPFNLFIEFIKFRNRLVHAKSWETEHLTLVTGVNLNEKMQGSWSGKPLDVKSLQLEDNYPLTKFSRDLSKLNIRDAEKALEIALMTIYHIRTFIPGSYTTPGLIFRVPKNNIDYSNGPGLLDMITRYYT